MAVYTDDFNRADEFSIGSPWSTVVGGSRFSIDSGSLAVDNSPSNAFPALLLYQAASFASDKQFVEIDNLSTGAASSFSFFGGYLSAEDFDTRSGYWAYVRPQANNFVIVEVSPSGNTSLATAAGAASRPFRTRFERDGLFLRLYKDDVLVLEHEISGTPLTGTRFGLCAHPNSLMFADNFEGGDLASVTTTPALSTPTATAVTSNSISFSIPVSY